MISKVCCVKIIRSQIIWPFRLVGLLNLPKQVFYASLILHQCRSVELYLFFSVLFITVGCWEKSGIRKVLAVRFCQTPIEDGLDIALVQVAGSKMFPSFSVFSKPFWILKPITQAPCRAFSGAKFSQAHYTGQRPKAQGAGARLTGRGPVR